MRRLIVAIVVLLVGCASPADEADGFTTEIQKLTRS